MKKIVMCLLAISMVLSLCSCGEIEDGEKIVEIELGETYTVEYEYGVNTGTYSEAEMIWKTVGIKTSASGKQVIHMEIDVNNIGRYKIDDFLCFPYLVVDGKYEYSFKRYGDLDYFNLQPLESSSYKFCFDVPSEVLEGSHTYVFRRTIGDCIYEYTCYEINKLN